MAAAAGPVLARADLRTPNQLRPLSGEPGVLSRADGSARFSHDKTEVIVAVYGPAEVKRSREQLDAATIEVIVRPRAGIPGPPERELEQLLASTLQPCLITTLHPRTAISIVVQVVHDDGGLISAALNGACVALMHAGVPMRGVLAGCAIAMMPSGDALLDPSLEEQQAATACVTYGVELRQRADQPQTMERRLLLSHVRGRISQEHYDLCLRAAQEAGVCLAAFYRRVLQRATSELPAEVE
tara:strand:- start:100 stop:825 length:726 start_codon:yes stop_codon:yes gene_type:complete